MSQPLFRAAAITGLSIALVAAPTAALAAAAHHRSAHPTTHGHAGQHRPTHSTGRRHGSPSHSTAKTKAVVHGLVVSRSGNDVVVLAHTAKIGKRAVHNQVEHLTLAASGHKFRTVQPGYELTARGQEDNGSIVNATVQSSTPQPAGVVVGTVDSVDGNLVSICALGAAGGSHDGSDGSDGSDGNGDSQGGDGQGGDGQGGGDAVAPQARTADNGEGDSGCSGGDGQGDALVTDTSAAGFAGAVSSAADLASGQFVAALGEQSHGVFVATEVFAYANQPTVVIGQVTAADLTASSITVAPATDDSSDDSVSAGTPVDTSEAVVMINGVADGGYPAVGDEALVLGPDAANQSGSPVLASLVFDFNANNTQPVDDEGGDSGD